LFWNRDIPAVIAACADRTETWISHDIERLYVALAAEGHVHAVSAYDADDTLVGGVYGLMSEGCFCGESMFHRANDAAKLSVIALVSLLRQHAVGLLDCQQQTPHMERLGAFEIDDTSYAAALAAAPVPQPLPRSAQLFGGDDPEARCAVALG
jgi:leucyl/phenylalanyl-tRNA--protein transferase